MSKSLYAHKLNVEGLYYCTDSAQDEGCIQCGLCPSNLPEIFAEDDEGSAYVHCQPNQDQVDLVEELILDCPVGSIKKLV